MFPQKGPILFTCNGCIRCLFSSVAFYLIARCVVTTWGMILSVNQQVRHATLRCDFGQYTMWDTFQFSAHLSILVHSPLV